MSNFKKIKWIPHESSPFQSHSGPIPLEFNHSGAIPVESGHSCRFRCHSSAIPAELPDSGRNLWGTVKYCLKHPYPPLLTNPTYPRHPRQP